MSSKYCQLVSPYIYQFRKKRLMILPVVIVNSFCPITQCRYIFTVLSCTNTILLSYPASCRPRLPGERRTLILFPTASYKLRYNMVLVVSQPVYRHNGCYMSPYSVSELGIHVEAVAWYLSGLAQYNF